MFLGCVWQPGWCRRGLPAEAGAKLVTAGADSEDDNALPGPRRLEGRRAVDFFRRSRRHMNGCHAVGRNRDVQSEDAVLPHPIHGYRPPHSLPCSTPIGQYQELTRSRPNPHAQRRMASRTGGNRSSCLCANLSSKLRAANVLSRPAGVRQAHR